MSFTASSAGRFVACPASVLLPRTPDVETEYARAGTIKHEYLERVGNAASQDLARVKAFMQGERPIDILNCVDADYRDDCESIELPDLRASRGECLTEVTFAMNVFTGVARVVGAGLNRDYSDVQPSEICGTADVVQVLPDSVYISDYKTGREVPHPSSNWQLKTLSVMASAAYAKESVTASITYIRPDGEVYEVTHVFDSLDLVEARVQLMNALKYSEMLAERDEEIGLEDVHPGEHCRYCPAFRNCPSQASLVETMLTTQEETTLDRPADLYLTWQRMKRLTAEVGAIVHAHARARPIQLPDGREYSERKSTREKIDANLALPALSTVVPGDVALSASSQSVTKASIQRAVREFWSSLPPDSRPTLKSLMEQASKALREAGAVSKVESRSFGERKASVAG